MVKVRLTFAPPMEDDIVKLHIFEAPTASGTWAEIDNTTNIGVAPSYISHFTTQLATSVDDWFSIAWEDAGGAVGALSFPVRGETLLSLIVARVLERDPAANVAIVVQEAEVVISLVMGTNDVRLLVPSDATIRQIAGMTYLTLARVLMSDIVISSTSESYVAGLISEKSSSSTKVRDNIQQLLDFANLDLGLGTSVILQMAEAQIGNSVSGWELDQSRLVLEVAVQ